MCGIWALLSKKDITDFGVLYEAFMTIKNRGPEYSSFDLVNARTLIGFHRLAIMDMTAEGNQPFKYVRKDGSCVYCICNGEIYDFEFLKQEYGISTKSHSDCEVIIPLYEKIGFEKMMPLLGSEFACMVVDISKEGRTKVFVGRDPVGIRPLFFSVGKDHETLCISSEMKGLSALYKEVNVFPPGHFLKFDDSIDAKVKIESYFSYTFPKFLVTDATKEDLLKGIRMQFEESVKKRMITDRPYGCLLSGGLDSSLVCSVAKRYSINDKPFPVFTISFEEGGTDLPYAKRVAEFLELDHTSFLVTKKEALEIIPETIYAIESWDVTTVRASVMQMLLGKRIKQETNIRVLMVGEVSDEIFMGYLYGHYAPSMEEAQADRIERVKDVHRFDGARTDRTMAWNGLEVRTPFGDSKFVDYTLSIPAEHVVPQNGVEKSLLREAFRVNEGEKPYLPDDVLFRRKEAFSDAVSADKKGESWYETIQQYVEEIITDEEFESNKGSFEWCPPETKEAYYYRKIFTSHFGEGNGKSKVIPYLWMPKWTDACDPSARTLTVYNK